MKYFIFLFFIIKIFSNEFIVSPVFPILIGENNIYATLEGVFSFYPSREKEKIFNLRKNETLKPNLSSYVSLKIDNEVIKLNQFKSALSEWDEESKKVKISYFHEEKEILVLFELNSIPERKNFFKVSYEIKNLSKKNHQIGLRIFQDVSTYTSEEGKLVVYSNFDSDNHNGEVKFTPFQSPYWETEFDKYRHWKLRNHILGEGITLPDKVAFTSFEKSYFSEWDYFTKKSNNITNDSAVILWWEPKLVLAEQSIFILQEFEISSYYDGFKFDLVNPNSGFGRLKLSYKNPFKDRISVDYKFESFPENSYIIENYKTNFSLSEGEHFDKSIPMTILGKRNILFIIKETRNGVERKYSIPINLSNSNRVQTLPFQFGSTYRVKYSTDKSDLKLKAVLKSKNDNRTLGEVDLLQTKNSKNEFLYTAEIDLKSFYGEVIEEIYIK